MAFVSFNKGYAQEAAKDPRTVFLSIDAPMKKARSDGLSSSEESPALNAVEDQLQAALAPEAAIEVGRRTGSGHRVFYFYVSGAEEAAAKAIAAVASKTTYALRYTWKQDPHKDGFWKTVYPDADGQQVMGDLSVLENLGSHHDDGDATHEVEHWTYFGNAAAASDFARWATQAGYAQVKTAPAAGKNGETVVTFTHHGQMHLKDISDRTIAIRRAAARLGGRYDGWETAIVPAR